MVVYHGFHHERVAKHLGHAATSCLAAASTVPLGPLLVDGIRCGSQGGIKSEDKGQSWPVDYCTMRTFHLLTPLPLPPFTLTPCTWLHHKETAVASAAKLPGMKVGRTDTYLGYWPLGQGSESQCGTAASGEWWRDVR